MARYLMMWALPAVLLACGPSFEPTGLEGRTADLAKERVASQACENVVRLIGEEPNRYWGEACAEAVKNNRSAARTRIAQAVSASALDLAECRQLAAAFKTAANAPLPNNELEHILRLVAETLVVGCKGVDPETMRQQQEDAAASDGNQAGRSGETEVRTIRASPVSRTGSAISLSAAGCRFVTVTDELATATYLAGFKQYFGQLPGKLFFKPTVSGMTLHIVGAGSHKAPVSLEFPAFSAVSFVATGDNVIPVHGTVLVLPGETRDIPLRPEVGGAAVEIRGVSPDVSVQVGRGFLPPGASSLCVRSGQEVRIFAGDNYKAVTAVGQAGRVVQVTLVRSDGSTVAPRPAEVKTRVSAPAQRQLTGALEKARFNMACSAWADSLGLNAARHRSNFMSKCLDRLESGDTYTNHCLRDGLNTNDFSHCVLR